MPRGHILHGHKVDAARRKGGLSPLQVGHDARARARGLDVARAYRRTGIHHHHRRAARGEIQRRAFALQLAASVGAGRRQRGWIAAANRSSSFGRRSSAGRPIVPMVLVCTMALRPASAAVVQQAARTLRVDAEHGLGVLGPRAVERRHVVELLAAAHGAGQARRVVQVALVQLHIQAVQVGARAGGAHQTASPRRRQRASARTTAEPTKPVPPVTKARISRLLSARRTRRDRTRAGAHAANAGLAD